MFSLCHIKQRRAAGVVNMCTLCAVYWWDAAGLLGITSKIFPQKSLSAFRATNMWSNFEEEFSAVSCSFCENVCESVCAGRPPGDSPDFWVLLSLWSVKDDASSRRNGPPTCPHCKTNMSTYSISHLASFAVCKNKKQQHHRRIIFNDTRGKH